MKANIQIYNTVNLGSTQLAPGEYQLAWTGSGTSAEATFSEGKKLIATVPAQVTQERSGYSGPALHTDSVSSTLTGVELPKVSLSFTTTIPSQLTLVISVVQSAGPLRSAFDYLPVAALPLANEKEVRTSASITARRSARSTTGWNAQL
jgi:hypothetical protein